MGSHSEAMGTGRRRLRPSGWPRIISRFLAELELDDDVTIVANDSGGAVSQILVTEMPDRVGRLVLTNCDSFEKFPPGRFKLMAKAVQPSFAYTFWPTRCGAGSCARHRSPSGRSPAAPSTTRC